MQRQIWSKPRQWLHNLTKAHCPSQLYLQLFLLLYFSSPTIFHIRPIFNLFSLVFSHPHMSTVSNSLIFTLITFEFYPIFYEIYTLKLTHYLIFSWLHLSFYFFTLTRNLSQFSSLVFSLFSVLLSLSLWWISKFVKHDCVNHKIPLVLILLFLYNSSYEAKRLQCICGNERWDWFCSVLKIQDS